ncbi:MAG: LPS export ABC transporter periplasmic protein LptC [Methylobacteriaceae bacterium]|nr:LPS export ABC transporter periplasmic protein LptC [Methylobacteriaceae bacterium]
MTDVTRSLDGGTAWSRDGAGRSAAFLAAERHSGRVRLAKRAMVVGSCVAVVVLLVIAIFDPFHRLVPTFSVEGMAVNGAKVSMQLPELAGYRKDGRPYQMKARTMTQDPANPQTFDLTAVEGVIGMADKGSATITGNSGVYDNASNSMNLQGDVHMTNGAGYEAFLQSVHIDFKTNGMVSKQPVKVFVDTTTVTADSMEVIDGGRTVIFDGRVKSVMLPAKEAGEATATLKGTTQ